LKLLILKVCVSDCVSDCVSCVKAAGLAYIGIDLFDSKHFWLKSRPHTRPQPTNYL